MLKTIVVATDGSDHARKAVVFAADLAAKYDARLVLTHVLLRGELSETVLRWAESENVPGAEKPSFKQAIESAPKGPFPTTLMTFGDRQETPYRLLETVGQSILKVAGEEAKKHGAAKIDERILDGDPVKRILETAEEEKADLLVSGARGLSDMKALLVGSVSHKLATLAPMTFVSVR